VSDTANAGLELGPRANKWVHVKWVGFCGAESGHICRQEEAESSQCQPLSSLPYITDSIFKHSVLFYPEDESRRLL
jgi:hypothetical protein